MTDYNYQKDIPANRTYKSRIFEMIFSNKKDLLSLYNATNGTHYDDPELLEVNTLENAIYLSMHNDISFVIDSRLTLYEHQSTYSPNLPLRYLMYISDLYSNMTKDENLYGTRKILLPAPKFVIFYNGIDEQPDMQELRLSDMFEIVDNIPSLDLRAVMLNINPGHNPHLLDNCKTLRDYSEYTARVRRYAESSPLSEAVEQAITECIKEGILAEFLSKNRAEAKKVSIYEYDEEKVMRMLQEDARETGRQEGETQKLKEQISKKLAKGNTPEEISEMLEEPVEHIRELIAELSQKASI
ncbi:hypothetical protein NE683_09965 [Bariatricus massiliensis]|uniref:Transposase (putative) YhgA-like domain-containing protein n=1 Tax=Bariatricus massiliensis TaxID=1745713 RepID=A0ABS8DDF9_9FIRM|nr:hypothetical protein [Bariatricus massiliensis]MCB7302556.1 hypothetical protein [Bariatricus massiliensis]MCB7373772.1 hypothetical protein [Bariatricus massiliensis]MCB7386442.1 hypothetical protein [Bariatricus massiliensis]MCB7410604.1 hypothetical protein [Bariatricus massiliensis]MCQ5253559.1 hypothetical protein [Bariatricus massiliensis]